jgi:hypothetical protein
MLVAEAFADTDAEAAGLVQHPQEAGGGSSISSSRSPASFFFLSPSFFCPRKRPATAEAAAARSLASFFSFSFSTKKRPAEATAGRLPLEEHVCPLTSMWVLGKKNRQVRTNMLNMLPVKAASTNRINRIFFLKIRNVQRFGTFKSGGFFAHIRHIFCPACSN